MSWLATEIPKLGPDAPARNVQQLKKGMNVIAALLRNKAALRPTLETPEKPKAPKKRAAATEAKVNPKGAKPLGKGGKSGKGKGKELLKGKGKEPLKGKGKEPLKGKGKEPLKGKGKEPPKILKETKSRNKSPKPKPKVAPAPKITKQAKSAVPTVRIVGKGGPKGRTRVLAQLQQTLKGISKPDLRRLARRAGVQRMSAAIMDEMREALQIFLKKTLSDVVVYVEHAKRKTAMPYDVVLSLRRQSRSLYGYV